jgi:hypothetical protein
MPIVENDKRKVSGPPPLSVYVLVPERPTSTLPELTNSPGIIVTVAPALPLTVISN